MKRILFTTVLLIAIGLTGFSQSGVFSGGLGNRTLRKTGLVIRPEVGFAVYEQALFSIGTNIGYQITPHVYVGGGISCFVDPIGRYCSNTGSLGHENVESLYASFRWYWFDGRFSPYLDLNLGIGRYEFYRYNDNWYYDYYYDDEYYYNYDSYNSSVKVYPCLSLAVGYDIKNFDIQLGLCTYGHYIYSYYPTPITPYMALGYNILIK